MNLRETLCTSLKRADRVLYLVDLPLSHAALQRIHTRTYCNGREQGFTVQVHSGAGEVSLQLSFAEQRNSDSLVLYVGRVEDFDEHGIPRDEVYEAAKTYAPKSGKHGAMRAAEEKLARDVTKLVVKAAKDAAKAWKLAKDTVPAPTEVTAP
jgi:hypothetical protein